MDELTAVEQTAESKLKALWQHYGSTILACIVTALVVMFYFEHRIHNLEATVNKLETHTRLYNVIHGIERLPEEALHGVEELIP